MKTSTVAIAGLIFAVLLIGGLFTLGVIDLPVVKQVTSPDASTSVTTDTKLTQFALVTVGALGGIISIGAGLSIMLWAINRANARLQAAPDNPLSFSLKPEGNSIGAFLQKNSFFVSIAVGLGLLLTFIVIAALAGAL